MTLTAKTTTAALKAHVFGLLKDAGFDDWTGRKACRRRAGCIDTVEFRSVSSYDAQVMGCSTASLSVWFGSWPDCFLPAQYPLKQGPKGPRPNEYEMPLRGHLVPSNGMAVRMSRRIWDIRTEDDATKAAQDVATQLQDAALAWLSIEWDAQKLLDHIEASTGYEDPIHSSPTGARLSVLVASTTAPPAALPWPSLNSPLAATPTLRTFMKNHATR